MLLVAHATRPEYHLPPPSAWILWVGGILGVITIPCYALGYRAVARIIQPNSPNLRIQAPIVLGCGVGIGAAGALIHGLTALSIQDALASGAAAHTPVEAIAASGQVFLAAWIIGSLLVLVASIAIFIAIFTVSASVGASHVPVLPRWLAWLNPAVITVLLAMLGVPWEVGRSFLIPAAPNLAHAIFSPRPSRRQEAFIRANRNEYLGFCQR